MQKVTWCEGRDGFGTVLGEELPDGGYPVLSNGLRLAQAWQRYGAENVTVSGRLPVTVCRPCVHPVYIAALDDFGCPEHTPIPKPDPNYNPLEDQ